MSRKGSITIINNNINNNNNNTIEKGGPKNEITKGFIVAAIYIILNITLSITNKWLFKYEVCLFI